MRQQIMSTRFFLSAAVYELHALCRQITRIRDLMLSKNNLSTCNSGEKNRQHLIVSIAKTNEHPPISDINAFPEGHKFSVDLYWVKMLWSYE